MHLQEKRQCERAGKRSAERPKNLGWPAIYAADRCGMRGFFDLRQSYLSCSSSSQVRRFNIKLIM